MASSYNAGVTLTTALIEVGQVTIHVDAGSKLMATATAILNRVSVNDTAQCQMYLGSSGSNAYGSASVDGTVPVSSLAVTGFWSVLSPGDDVVKLECLSIGHTTESLAHITLNVWAGRS